MVLSMLPAAAAFAATNHYITNVKASANGTSVSATSTTTPAHLKVWYQFRATTPQGHTWILRRFEASPTFTWTPPKSGTYHVQAFALTQYQVATHQWKAAVAGTTVTDSQVSSISISGAPSGSVAPNTAETLSVVAKNSAGNVVSNPGTPTWSVSPTSGATLQNLTDGGVVFDASTAGNYTVTATLDGQTATATVAVYGTASAIKLTPKSSSLAADDAATDVVTATVVDSNGNVVGNYNGTATISGNGLITDATNSGLQASDVSSGHTLTFTNGTATFVLGPTSAQETATITASNSTLTTGTTTVDVVSPTVTALGLNVSTGSPPDLSANSSTSAANGTSLTLSTLDAQGNPVTSGEYVTLHLTGPGSFDPTTGGATPVTAETLFVDTPTSTVNIYGVLAETGTVTVTAMSSGLTTATVNVPSYIIGSPARLSVSSTVQTSSSTGNTYMHYTVDVLDANGHAIPGNTDTLTAAISNANSGVVEMSTTSSSFSTTSTVSAPASNGVFSFNVETKTVGSGAATIAISDSTHTAVPTVDTTYSYTAESPHYVAVSPTGAYYVKAGQSVAVDAQITDINGNPVSEAGQSITFSATLPAGVTFPNGSSSTYTATTNSSGLASATLTAGSSEAGATGVSVTVTDTTTSLTQTGTTDLNFESAANTTNYPTQLLITSGSTTTEVSTLAQTASGSAFTTSLNVAAKNAVGSSITGSQSYDITSSNPNVVAVTTGTVSTSTASSYLLSNDLSVGMAGSAVITVKDVSDQAAPTQSFTVTVTPGAEFGTTLEYKGAPISSTNPLSIAANTPVELQVVNGDKNGDPLPITGTTGASVSLAAVSGVTGAFEGQAGGGPITSTTIVEGQSTVNVWFESATSETISSTSELTATLQPGVSVPTGVSASEVSGGIKTAWNAVSGAKGYDVLRSTSSSTGFSIVSTASATATSYTNTSLSSPGTKYYYEVEALGYNSIPTSASTVSGAMYGAKATTGAVTSWTTTTASGGPTTGTITVTYNNALSSSVTASDFTVKDGSTTMTVTSPILNSSTDTVTLTVSASVSSLSSTTVSVTSTTGLTDSATNPVTTDLTGL